MPGLIDEVFVRIRPEIAGFAAETTAGIRGALTEVNAQVAAGAKANVAAAATEIDANRAVAGSYLGIAEAAQAPIRSMAEIQAAAVKEQATVASVAKANVAQLMVERDANLQLAASYETIAKAAIHGSEQQIAATKLAAEAAVRAGVEVRGAAAAESAAIGGVKKHLLSLGNILGVSFGAAIGIHFVKQIVGGAAESQRAVEAIRSRFGAASETVVQFGDKAARSLGISSTLADDTSARFGALFRNLGFGAKASAQMALGFEKLAGAQAAIRGSDPTDAMNAVLNAARGSTRALKQLDIVIDSASMKQAIFGKNASLITRPLTAAEKTLAIYRIATRQLGVDMARVSANSGDLSFKQRQLAAEFANAKGALGEALIPAFSKYTGELVHWLGRMQKSGKLQHDFNSIARTAKGIIDGVVGAIKIGVGVWNTFSDAVGGAKTAITILLGAMAVSKFASVVSSIKMTGSTILGLGKTALMASARVGVALGIIDAASIATGLTIKAAIVSTGIGAIIVGIGIATAYIITHWDQVKRWTMALGAVMAQIWKGIKEIIIGAAEAIGGGIVAFMIFPMKEFIDIAASAVGWIPWVGDGVSAVRDKVDGLYDSMKNLASHGKDQIVQGARDIGKVGQAWSDSMAASASSPSAKDKMKKAGGELGQALGDGVAGAATNLEKPLKPVLTALHNAIQSAKTKIHQTVSDAKDNLVKIGDDLAKTIARIQEKIGGAAGAIAGSPQGQAFAKLKHLIESGAPSFQIARARAELASQLQNVGKTTQPQIKTDLDNLTSAFNRGKITYAQFQDRLHKILREDGVTMAQALKIGGAAFAQTMKAQIAALGEQAKAIAAVPAKYRGIGGAGGDANIRIIRPLQVIQQEQAKIGAAAERQRHQLIRYAHQMAKYQANLLEQQKEEHRARVQAQREKEAHAHARKAAREAAHRAAVKRQHDASGPAGPVGPMMGNTGSTGAGAPPTTERLGPGGPRGPMGPSTHLERIRAGIVHQTATDSVQRKQQLIAVQHVSAEIGRLGGEFARSEEAHVARPLAILHRDNNRIAAKAEHQRAALLRAAQRTNTELRGLRRGRTPGFGNIPPGKGGEDARIGAKVGNRA